MLLNLARWSLHGWYDQKCTTTQQLMRASFIRPFVRWNKTCLKKNNYRLTNKRKSIVVKEKIATQNYSPHSQLKFNCVVNRSNGIQRLISYEQAQVAQTYDLYPVVVVCLYLSCERVPSSPPSILFEMHTKHLCSAATQWECVLYTVRVCCWAESVYVCGSEFMFSFFYAVHARNIRTRAIWTYVPMMTMYMNWKSMAWCKKKYVHFLWCVLCRILALSNSARSCVNAFAIKCFCIS